MDSEGRRTAEAKGVRLQASEETAERGACVWVRGELSEGPQTHRVSSEHKPIKKHAGNTLAAEAPRRSAPASPCERFSEQTHPLPVQGNARALPELFPPSEGNEVGPLSPGGAKQDVLPVPGTCETVT
ncbi:hypothetical protein AAFF_G00424690 [Aldrovandia affinis]|uniref:Uncharacterized protein n=1 Tax=Aldrovandia affinis TaxID=143900 RepID=A0AAD7T6U3_9TELE|nr:hypothetical protein AAFF_G00424690 [Aldrovandia affinis]